MQEHVRSTHQRWSLRSHCRGQAAVYQLHCPLKARRGAVAHFAPSFQQAPDPAANSIVSAAPQEVTLTFTDTLEAAFSDLTVMDGNGVEVSQGKARVNNNTMRVGLKSLNVGVYKVIWRAVSTDTHRTDGSFTFRVNAQ